MFYGSDIWGMDLSKIRQKLKLLGKRAKYIIIKTQLQLHNMRICLAARIIIGIHFGAFATNHYLQHFGNFGDAGPE